MARSQERSVSRSALLVWAAVDVLFKAATLPALLPTLQADRSIDIVRAWAWAVGTSVVLVLASAMILERMLRPIARWQALSSTERDADVVTAASRAAAATPARFGAVWAVHWQLLFVVLLLATRGASLTAAVVGGTALMMATALVAVAGLGQLLCGWLLGDTRGRLSLEERALGIVQLTRELSVRARLVLIALSIGFSPFLYLACVTYVREVTTGVSTPGAFLLMLLVFGIAVAAYGPLCAWLVARGVVDPVARMSAVLRQIARGGDGASVPRIPRQRADEIGALADVTNEMLDRLEQTATERAVFAGELEHLNRTLQQRVEAAQARIQEGQRQLLLASRRAGMSEVATAVLHDIGNALNSLNVSGRLVTNRLRDLEVDGVRKAAELLRRDDEPRHAKLAEYLDRLHAQHGRQREAILDELGGLAEHVDRIKTIVSRQQAHARASIVAEPVRVDDLVEQAIGLAPIGPSIRIERDFAGGFTLVLDRHRVLEILLNLLGNAVEAIAAADVNEGVLSVALRRDEGGPRIEVRDNGIGIATENVARLFAYGFTTKTKVSGLGLHGSANAAVEMGGSLTCTSDGPGRGACFVLALPDGDTRQAIAS